MSPELSTSYALRHFESVISFFPSKAETPRTDAHPNHVSAVCAVSLSPYLWRWMSVAETDSRDAKSCGEMRWAAANQPFIRARSDDNDAGRPQEDQSGIPDGGRAQLHSRSTLPTIETLRWQLSTHDARSESRSLRAEKRRCFSQRC